MIGNGDYDGFANELMLEPNRIFSIIDRDNYNVPLVYHCGKSCDSNPRMIDPFFNSLTYYHNVILQSKEKESDFVKRYLNFNDCANLISHTNKTLNKNELKQLTALWNDKSHFRINLF